MGARTDFYRDRLSVSPRVYASTSTSGQWWDPLRILGMSKYTLRATSDECTGDEVTSPSHLQTLALKTPTLRGQKSWTRTKLLNCSLPALHEYLIHNNSSSPQKSSPAALRILRIYQIGITFTLTIRRVSTISCMSPHPTSAF